MIVVGGGHTPANATLDTLGMEGAMAAYTTADGASKHCPCGNVLSGRQLAWCSPACRERLRPKRKRPSGAQQRKKYGRPGWKTKAKPFIAVDGESVTVGDKHTYVLLAAADDEGHEWYVEDPDGLSTEDCLDFLTSLPKAHVWGFGFGYDVNMMLGDLGIVAVHRLYTEGQTYWRRWWIKYVPGKRLQVSRRDRHGPKRTAGVWDMFPWQQRSFVKWIAEWKLAPEHEIDRIRSMKAQRSSFAIEERKAIRDYCLAECRYLAAGARRMVEDIEASGIKVKGSYYSPASVSKALLREHQVMQYASTGPEHLRTAIDAAYIGGRAEVSQVGPMGGPFHAYDIRSAYPTHMANLPCLAHGHWVQDPDEGIDPWSLVKVHWRVPRNSTWGPLPMRPKTGSLRWPTTGTAWCWGVEVLAALRRYDDIEMEVLDQWTLYRNCDHRPFAYIPELYEERARRKAAGDRTELVLKLALNATYGALAERRDEARYRCKIWAGWITAATRAQILDALTDEVVFIATDCVMSRSTLPLDIGEGLGQWEHAEHEEVIIAGPGVYFVRHGDEWTSKTRGFASGALNLDDFLAAWHTNGRSGEVRMQRDRFVGMGTAFHRIGGFFPPQHRLWRRFITEAVVKRFDISARRDWISDDPHDGRTRAPSCAAHKRTEKQDSDTVTRLQAEVFKLAKTIDFLSRPKPGREIPPMIRERIERMSYDLTLKTAALLSHSRAEEDVSLFDEASEYDPGGW